MPTSIRLRPLIVVTCLLLVICTGVAVALLAYTRSSEQLIGNAMRNAQRTGEVAGRDLALSLGSIRSTVPLLANNPALQGKDLAERMQALPVMALALEASPVARAFYFANREGDLFYLRRPMAELDGEVPAEVHFMLLSIERDEQQLHGMRIYLDKSLREIRRREDPAVARLDPRQRDWFRRPLQTDHAVHPTPYAYFTSSEIGYSLAMASDDRQRVVAADYRHRLVDEMLYRQRPTPSSRIVLLNDMGRVLASGRPDELPRGRSVAGQVSALNNAILEALRSVPAGQLGRLRHAGRLWYVQRQSLPGEAQDPLYLGLAVPEDELLREAHALRTDMLLEISAILLLAVPLGIWLAGLLAKSLTRLSAKAERLQHFDFSSEIRVHSRIAEVQQLGQVLAGSRETLQRFIDIVLRLNGEADFERLLSTLLHSTSEACHAPGALLYIRQQGDDELCLAAGRWEGGELELAVRQPLFAVAESLANRTTLAREADVATCTALGLPPMPSLSVPLYTRSGHGVGVLVLLHEQPPSVSAVRFIEALAGFAALALETRGLLEQQRALFESFTQLIAGAIDAKSPYTGGHCSRVPEVVRCLAEAVCRESQGPYAGFYMDENDWQALHVAAWLHDCGKVTTPEYVVDKATKLETLYDRIHEIRTRFEVLKRDAEIACLRAIGAGVDEVQAQAECDALLRTLDEEFAFVAECNTGFIDDARLLRLQAIAERTWLRTLDDRLGISGEERLRKEKQPTVGLPAPEKLLVDRPEQRIERGAGEGYAADNPWGLRMPIPELLYDRGELKNLSIRRGTLTDEERYKINEHSVQTIKMLSALPFPPELAQIPEIAGSHHERMDGKGYPRGLTAQQLSPQARMLAIADVFEALTARDRPYKPSKTLAQALRIMRSMCAEGHLDAELFRIFVQSGACLEYARRHMAEDQLDVADTREFLPQEASGA
jgi:HD-GYP domain-containing protein (c-di-GMP phosphodiesterase class II)